MVHGAAKCQTWLSNTHIIHYEIQLYMSFLKYPVSLCALSIHIPPFTFPFIYRSWIYAHWFRGERQQSGKIKVTKFIFLSWIFFSKSMSQVLSGSAKKSSSLVWRWGWEEGKHKSSLSRAKKRSYSLLPSHTSKTAARLQRGNGFAVVSFTYQFDRLRDAQTEVKCYFRVCLWRCFQKRLAFDSVEWRIAAFTKAGVHLPIPLGPE